MKGRRKYSPEFREQAVNRTLSGSFTIKEVANSLEISYFILRQWRAEYLEKEGNGTTAYGQTTEGKRRIEKAS
ncbi:transposase [Leptospira borgpetersenii serovar Pomona str. 200901868]|uniref:Transposase n=1 Tax=Leptospira borgpetersenii serovar Pomona str. 200901868 TaxID=1192866 RepID=M6W9I2_LEPBO|nr:transposase [Leptospira borgpetersenii serovar Pomona str. 200901868]